MKIRERQVKQSQALAKQRCEDFEKMRRCKAKQSKEMRDRGTEGQKDKRRATSGKREEGYGANVDSR
eukprot:scaffold1166_cov261-Pinguiococcus_pyrenoidosus.AAC.23